MHGATDLENIVVGPTSSTNNAIVCWNGTTSNFIQNSTVLLSDMKGFAGNCFGHLHKEVSAPR
jgi:hypothetical protein